MKRKAPYEIKKIVYCGKIKWLPEKIKVLKTKMSRKGYELVEEDKLHLRMREHYTYYVVLLFKKRKTKE